MKGSQPSSNGWVLPFSPVFLFYLLIFCCIFCFIAHMKKTMVKYRQTIEYAKEQEMIYRALFLDIDGTILTYNHTYTELTKKAIQEAQSNGVEVFFASGRPLHELNSLRKELGIHSAICYNGAYAIYKDDVIVNEPMDPEIVQRILSFVKQYHNELVLYTDQKNYFTSLTHPEVIHFIDHFQLKENDLISDNNTKPIYSMTVMHLLKEQLSIYKDLPNLEVSRVNIDGISNAYDLIQKNINKGTAVQQVLHILNIPKEKAIAFGDGMNDREMLQNVGESFIMANGDPNLFPYAKHQTKSVDESGVYYGLKKLGVVE